jgi:hypothetical protein
MDRVRFEDNLGEHKRTVSATSVPRAIDQLPDGKLPYGWLAIPEYSKPDFVDTVINLGRISDKMEDGRHTYNHMRELLEAMTLERDQLAARVVELESEVCWNRKRNDKHGMTNFEDGVGGGKTSALLIHDAEVLENAVKDELDDTCMDEWERGYLAAMEVIARRATKLRKQAQ